MQSHLDDDTRQKFWDRLRERAGETKSAGKSTIAGGTDGESPLAEWESNGVGVRQLPDDEQGILRISIGGGDDTPIVLNYCTFRGDHAKCVDLLRKALKAMEDRQG